MIDGPPACRHSSVILIEGVSLGQSEHPGTVLAEPWGKNILKKRSGYNYMLARQTRTWFRVTYLFPRLRVFQRSQYSQVKNL